jgi:hypothetical protein
MYLPLAHGGGEWFVLVIGDIRKGETGPKYLYTEGKVGLRGSLEATRKENNLSLCCPQSNPRPSLNQPFPLLPL